MNDYFMRIKQMQSYSNKVAKHNDTISDNLCAKYPLSKLQVMCIIEHIHKTMSYVYLAISQDIVEAAIIEILKDNK